MRKEGCSEVLTRLAKKAKKQQAYHIVSWNAMRSTRLYMYKNDGLRWYHEGIAELVSSAVVEFGKERVIEVNVDSHALLRVNGEEVSGIEHAQVLDLSDDGERWEGDVLNNKPYGWGVLYDSENRRMYEGFRIGDVNVCYGRSYYSGIHAVEYEGCIYEGKRWGRGIQFDRNGGILHDGHWLNNEQEYRVAQRVLNDDNQLLTTLEQLRIHNVMGDGKEWKPLDFSYFLNLQLLEVGDYCFRDVKEMVVTGLKKLRTLKIGSGCYEISIDPPRGCFSLKDCPELTEVHIGYGSFSHYTVCEIEHLDAVRRIRMEGENFQNTLVLELRSDRKKMRMMNRNAKIGIACI